jgi:hypothetical protein
MATKVYLEVGGKKVFASAADWPGWCRAGKTEEDALEALAAYHPRYAVVAKKADVRFPKNAADSFDIVERVKGDATTDFGAPGMPTKGDDEPLTKAQADRQAKLVKAAWAVFDKVVEGAPASLRKGPRGGGRDRDKMRDHVADAEQAYARKLGLPVGSRERDDIAALLRTGKSEGAWPARYAARRVAWHVLDHAWEIEDRS